MLLSLSKQSEAQLGSLAGWDRGAGGTGGAGGDGSAGGDSGARTFQKVIYFVNAGANRFFVAYKKIFPFWVSGFNFSSVLKYGRPCSINET